LFFLLCYLSLTLFLPASFGILNAIEKDVIGGPSMIAQNISRVTDNTADRINQRIRAQMQSRVAECAERGPEEIYHRLRELDAEWDIERTIETMASSFTLAGLFLGLTVNRKFLIFPVAVAGFLLQHSLQGWCPPIPVLRRLGFRTAEEIAQERYALKSLRGDFLEVSEEAKNTSRDSANAALQATME
jgi:hypothetical protein